MFRHMTRNTKINPSTVGVRVRSNRIEQKREEEEKGVVHSSNIQDQFKHTNHQNTFPRNSE